MSEPQPPNVTELRGYGCDQCDGWNDPYMLKNEVWEIIAGRKRFLCLQCAETALGRPLTIEDFSEAGINTPIRFGYTIGRRDQCR